MKLKEEEGREGRVEGLKEEGGREGRKEGRRKGGRNVRLESAGLLGSDLRCMVGGERRSPPACPRRHRRGCSLGQQSLVPAYKVLVCFCDEKYKALIIVVTYRSFQAETTRYERVL